MAWSAERIRPLEQGEQNTFYFAFPVASVRIDSNLNPTTRFRGKLCDRVSRGNTWISRGVDRYESRAKCFTRIDSYRWYIYIYIGIVARFLRNIFPDTRRQADDRQLRFIYLSCIYLLVVSSFERRVSKSGTLFRLIETRALGYKGHGRLEKMNADLAQLSKIMLYGKTLFMRNNWKIRISGILFKIL